MRHHISYKGLDKKSRMEIDTLVSQYKDHLARILELWDTRDVSMRGLVEKHTSRKLYRFILHLHLPRRKVLSVHEEGDNIQNVIKEAFTELGRKVDRIKSRVRNEHLWKRKARRKLLRSQKQARIIEEKTPGKEPATPKLWFGQIQKWLPHLYDFSRREIIYLQNSNDLSPEDIQPDELVDEVLVTAFENLDKKPEQLDLKAWLFQTAIHILDQEVEKSRTRRLTISLEEVVPDKNIDENIYDFYQPDEVLTIEELIGIEEHVPQDEAEQLLKMQLLAQPALAQLPHIWRRAALLHHQAGLSIPEVAMILALEEQKVMDLMNSARDFLSERIRQGDVEMETDLRLILKTCIRFTSPASLVDELKEKFSK